MALPLTNEIKTKLAKYLCLSYNRWNFSRGWDSISEDVRNEWLVEAEELIVKMNDESEDWRDDYWPLGKG